MGNFGEHNLGGDDKQFGINGPDHIEQPNSSSDDLYSLSESGVSPLDLFSNLNKDISIVEEHQVRSFGEEVVSYGEEYQGKVRSYDQLLQFERELRGWKPEELAERIDTPVSKILAWEKSASIELASRQKLTKLLGNNFYPSSEVKTTSNGTALQVRIVQLLLTAQDFTTIISVLTEFHTVFRLVQQGRFEDLSRYIDTQDRGSVEESDLIIDTLSSNSPALITLLTDPHFITTTVTTGVTLALALQKATDTLGKSLILLYEEHLKKKLAREQKRKEDQLALKEKELELEQKRKEDQLALKEKELELLETTITKIVTITNTLNSGIDEQIKDLIKQAITPGCRKLLDRELLEFALPATQNSE